MISEVLFLFFSSSIICSSLQPLKSGFGPLKTPASSISIEQVIQNEINSIPYMDEAVKLSMMIHDSLILKKGNQLSQRQIQLLQQNIDRLEHLSITEGLTR